MYYQCYSSFIVINYIVALICYIIRRSYYVIYELIVKMPDTHSLTELGSIANSPTIKGSKTSLITINQGTQPDKTSCQSSSGQSGTDASQSLGTSSNSCTTKLSPIKMVQPLGFPAKLPPPPPQYQTTSTSSTNLLKTSVAVNKDQKSNPPIR